MRKFFFLWAAAFFLYACSSSDPRVYSTSVSDSTPVTGETVLIQVLSLSDHYPMTYAWSCDGGTMSVQADPTDNYIYWTAPSETPGTYHVTCRIEDEKDNAKDQDFTLVVRERVVEVLYSTATNATTALTIEKESYSIIGGIWASLSNAEMHYITSTTDAITSTWTGAFSAMTIVYDPASGNHALWGAYNQDYSDFDGNVISLQGPTGSSSLTCPYDTGTDIINAMIVSYENPGYYLMVGADSGLYWYHTDSETELWHNYSADYGMGKTYAFATTPDGLTGYAATNKGIYSFDLIFFTLSATPLYGDNLDLAGKETCAVAADNDGAVWHVTDSKLYKDEVLMNPPEVACTLAVDSNGNVWCGKYYWGSDNDWHTPLGLAPFTVAKVASSNEGRMYFVTDSGALLRY